MFRIPTCFPIGLLVYMETVTLNRARLSNGWITLSVGGQQAGGMVLRRDGALPEMFSWRNDTRLLTQ